MSVKIRTIKMKISKNKSVLFCHSNKNNKKLIFLSCLIIVIRSNDQNSNNNDNDNKN